MTCLNSGSSSAFQRGILIKCRSITSCSAQYSFPSSSGSRILGLNPSSYNPSTHLASMPMITASPYLALYSSGVMFFFPPLKHCRLVNQFSLFHAVKPLIGSFAVQPAQLFVVMPDLQVIQQRQQAFKGLDAVTAAVQAGFLSTSSDNYQCLPLLCGILAFSHEAHARDESGIPADESRQHGKQQYALVFPQIGRMTTGAAEGAVGNRDGQADFLRCLRHRHGILHEPKGTFSHPAPHSRNSKRRRCAARPA